MFKNIFGLAVLSRQLETLRRLVDGRLEPFRSALSRHTRQISSGLAIVVLVWRVTGARSNATRSMLFLGGIKLEFHKLTLVS
jgi:hypothetical protein